MVKDCAFGRENRVMIVNMESNIKRIEDKVDKGFANIDTRITELFNHQSSKLPRWVTIAGSVFSALLTGLGMWILTH